MAASVLTEEEKKIEYSRLFYKPLEKVDPQLLDILKKSPVKPEQITSIYQRNDILKPGYLEVENGYAKMDDGSEPCSPGLYRIHRACRTYAELADKAWLRKYLSVFEPGYLYERKYRCTA